MRHPRLLIALISIAAALAAACSKSDSSTSPSASSCAVTLGSVTTSVGAGASSGTLPVTAASSCSWTAASSASYLTITSGATGTGNGTVGYSFAANTGAARSASIQVNTSSVVFTQGAAAVLAPAGCTVKLSTTSAKANSGGGTVNVDVTADSNCTWTATSNASFLTATGGTTGSGTAVVTATANNGSSRSGTLTIGGQTVTITQDPGIFASFQLFDPAQSANATNVCQIRSATTESTTCTLRSTSFTQGAAAIVSYRWVVAYTYAEIKSIQQTTTVPELSFTETCGTANGGATDDGALQPVDVQLVVTDSLGNSATANSGVGNQPALQLQLFNCGK
jgi:hypothetical protein